MALTSEQQYAVLRILCEIASRDSDIQWSPIKNERGTDGSDHESTPHRCV